MKKFILSIILICFLTQLTGCGLMWNDYWGNPHWWNKDRKSEINKENYVNNFITAPRL